MLPPYVRVCEGVERETIHQKSKGETRACKTRLVDKHYHMSARASSVIDKVGYGAEISIDLSVMSWQNNIDHSKNTVNKSLTHSG
jgi:hypothetical protein